MHVIPNSLERLLESAAQYHPNEDMSVIRKAYAFAETVHDGQLRKDGSPYFTHLYQVALILADLMLDATTIAAGLLHDCVEDCKDVTNETLVTKFGGEIAALVDGVTKLSRIDFFSKEEQQAETLRKMLLAMAKDIRVVIIKLADRLHNMRTLSTQTPQRIVPIALETREVYAPLAHRLGIYNIKWELEDLSFKYIEPDKFAEIAALINTRREEREDELNRVMIQLRTELDKEGISAELDGRMKHIYSTYRKMITSDKSFDEIYDLIAIRLIVTSIRECYAALGIVHTLWKQIPGRFKDYISMPKDNMYQSLHTTMVARGGMPFEVQIRTREMHRLAEFGIAAHWRYKEGKDVSDTLDEKLRWLRQVLDWQKEAPDAQDFVEGLKGDWFGEEVFVFTPKGDLRSLPRGSTPIDFAYRIHTNVGNRCVGAKVNKHIVPLDRKLENGDFVEIMTSTNARGPSMDWLKIVHTSDAKSKIRAWLRRELRDENIVKGRDMLEKEAKRQGYTLSQLIKPDMTEDLFARYQLPTINDLYAAVGFGGLNTAQVMNRLTESLRKTAPAKEMSLDELQSHLAAREEASRKAAHLSNGVYVKGEADMLVRFAQCCAPIPGDAIVGYITRGRGVSVHRANCTNMNIEHIEEARIVDVSWEADEQRTYEAEISIVAIDRTGLFADLSTTLKQMDIPIDAVRASTNGDGTSNIHFTVRIKGAQQLDKVMKQLGKREDIIEILRASS